MKEIDEKLANELHEKIGDAEAFAAKLYINHKNDELSSDLVSLSCLIFDARQHLEWHMFRHENADGQ